MKKTIAFDIDGTLLNKSGKLAPETFAIFENPELQNSNIIFDTGNTQTICNALWEEVIKNFPHMSKVKPYLATVNGSVIYTPSGKIIGNRPLDKQKLLEIINKIKEYDPEVSLLYPTENIFYIHLTDNEKLREAANQLINYEAKKGTLGKPLDTIEGTVKEVIHKLGDIYGLMVTTPNNVEKIMELLKSTYKNEDFGIYYDPLYNIIMLTTGTKWHALKNIIEYEKSTPELSDFATDASDIFYFGDGENDCECLQKCKFSVARGNNLPEKVVKSAKYYADDITEITKMIFESK